MDTLYTFGDSITHSKNKSVDFLGLMNSATKLGWLPGSMWAPMIWVLGV